MLDYITYSSILGALILIDSVIPGYLYFRIPHVKIHKHAFYLNVILFFYFAACSGYVYSDHEFITFIIVNLAVIGPYYVARIVLMLAGEPIINKHKRYITFAYIAITLGYIAITYQLAKTDGALLSLYYGYVSLLWTLCLFLIIAVHHYYKRPSNKEKLILGTLCIYYSLQHMESAVTNSTPCDGFKSQASYALVVVLVSCLAFVHARSNRFFSELYCLIRHALPELLAGVTGYVTYIALNYILELVRFPSPRYLTTIFTVASACLMFSIARHIGRSLYLKNTKAYKLIVDYRIKMDGIRMLEDARVCAKKMISEWRKGITPVLLVPTFDGFQSYEPAARISENSNEYEVLFSLKLESMYSRGIMETQSADMHSKAVIIMMEKYGWEHVIMHEYHNQRFAYAFIEGAGSYLLLEELNELTALTRFSSEILEFGMNIQKIRDYERQAMMGQITSVVVHELRQPLVSLEYAMKSLSIFIDRMMTGESDKKEATRIGDGILRELERMHNLASSLLHVGTNRKEYDDITDFDLDGCLAKLHEVYMPTIYSSGINCIYDAGPSVSDFYIKANGKAIDQILRNLLNNAIDATVRVENNKERMIELGCSLEKRLNLPHLVITVRDSGDGVPPQVRDNLFAPFANSRRDVGSHGLGLFITKQLVEKTKGIITLDVIYDGAKKGSMFRIAWPAYSKKGVC